MLHHTRARGAHPQAARALSLAVAAALAAGAAVPAAAQTAAEYGALEEVVVTAERREQNLQDVPISATVLSADALRDRGVVNLNDIQQLAPSLAININNRSTFVNIRGVGIAQSAPTSVPGVAFYMDGHLVPSEQHISQSFFDIASVEVLRGPQGTLTGQNSTGGAVYVRTREPVYGEYSGAIDQTIGSYDWVRTIAAANFGFSENFALRIAAIHDDRDSFTRNIGPSPSQPGRYTLDAFRTNLAMRAADGRLRTNLRFEYYDYDSDHSAVKNRNDRVTADPFTIQEDAVSFLRQTGWRAGAEARFGLTGGIELRGLYSYQRSNTRDQVDGDRTATARPRPPAANVGRVAYARTDFLTQILEANVLSTGDGPVRWVVGAFAMRHDVPVSLLRDNNNTVVFVSSTSTIIARANNQSDSVFGQVDWSFTPQFEGILGLRYSRDEQEYVRVVVPGGISNFVGRPAESSETTGKLGLNWTPAEDMLVYATASKGYKAGGKNLTPDTPDYLPETNVVYEAGAKTTVFDGRLRLNGAVFWSDYEDIQLSSLFNNLPLQQNAASGRAYGAELEATAKFGVFGLNLGLGWLDAEFAKSATIVNTTTNRAELVPKGARLPFSPTLTASAGVDWTLDLGTAQVVPRLQWAHTAEQFSTPFPSVVSIVPPRDVVDLRVAVLPAAAWRVEAFATNVLDETYVSSQIANATSADGGIIYGAPRQYGLRLTVDFGR